MKGKLNEHPLAELIREISSQALSGTLRLEHERAQTAFYFENGQLDFAASNIRTLRLLEYVKKGQLLSETALASLKDNRSDLHLAGTLRTNGTLKQEQLDALLAAVVTDTLRVALLWTDGTWDFDQRARLDMSVSVNVDTNNLLREAAQRMEINFVSSRFRNPDEIISPVGNLAAGNNFTPTEGFVLSRLDVPTKLDDLVALSGLPEMEAHRIIYALAVGGLVTREHWPTNIRADVTQTSTQKTIAAPIPKTPPVKAPEPVVNLWTAATEDDDPEKFLERMRQATNHYEVLDLPQKADAGAVKNAYYALARRYHPDRFHAKSGTKLHDQISSAFAKITQAYETLTDPKTRATYDRGLERSRKFSESAPKAAKASPVAPTSDKSRPSATDAGQAEHNFREGFGALQQGKLGVATSHLATAARLEPQEARYRAYYGQALAANEQTRKLAENEIQAAVKFEPSNPAYRVLLAQLYFDLGFHRRAQTELDRALALDPNNADGRTLLRKLEEFPKVG